MTVASLAATGLGTAALLSAIAALAGLAARSRPARRLHHAAMITSAVVGLIGAFVPGLACRATLARRLAAAVPRAARRRSPVGVLPVCCSTPWLADGLVVRREVHRGRADRYPLRLVLPVTAVFVLSMQGVLLSTGVASFLLFWEAMSLSAFFLVMADGEEESRHAALLYLAIAQFGAGALIVGCGIIGGGSLFATFATLGSTVGLLSPGPRRPPRCSWCSPSPRRPAWRRSTPGCPRRTRGRPATCRR